MARLSVITLMYAAGRLVAILGAALTVGTIVAYTGGWQIFAFRYGPDWNVGILPLVFILQLFTAGWVTWNAIVASPRRFLRNVLAAFALSFLVFYGWYFLLAGGVTLALGNLLYLVAALPVAAAMITASAIEDVWTSNAAALEAMGGRVRVNFKALGMIFFVAAAATTTYAAMPAIPPPEAQTLGPPDQPPLSCVEGNKEIVAFDGSGAQTTAGFETTGLWGYEYASAGYGDIEISLLDEDGRAAYGDSDGPFTAGGVGGSEFASGGTFRFEIDADDDVRYEILVCDEEN